MSDSSITPLLLALALTRIEAAAALGVCPRTIDALIRDGKLVAFRVGRSVRIDRRDLLSFIDAQKREASRAA